jgi:hypothetical protein
MSDPGRERDEGQVKPTDAQEGASQHDNSRNDSSRTEGTNRDFDDSGESRNQGHGHPREERSDS